MSTFTSEVTITNGARLEVGAWVEWTTVLRHRRTGKHHRTVTCAGRYVGTFRDRGVLMAGFVDGRIGDTAQAHQGFPIIDLPEQDRAVVETPLQGWDD